MPFEALINDQDNKQLWFRCLHALSVLSEEIVFTTTPTRLILSGRNAGDTTLMDVTFDRRFFKSYRFESDSVEEGVAKLKGESVCSLSVRSKLLSMLFKKQEDDVDTLKIGFDGSADCPTSMKYRLQIDIITKTSIHKRFSPFYVPCSLQLSHLADRYKEDFINQKQLGRATGSGTNYMIMGNAMLRGFLDNAGGSTEHLRFEVNAQRFSITAFTRGVYIKEKEILKQPMAVNMQFRSEDLHNLEIGDDNHNIVLRLKDFKNFLMLGNPGEVTESYFKQAGDPILFEMLKNNVTIQLIQDTDGENHITNDKPAQNKNPNPVTHHRAQRAVPVETDLETRTEPLFVPDDESQGNDDANDKDNEYATERGDTDVGEDSDDPGDREPSQEEQQITWGDPNAGETALKKLIGTREQVIENAKTEYLDGLKRRKLEKQKQREMSEEVEMLGPTQDVSRAKGLFD